MGVVESTCNRSPDCSACNEECHRRTGFEPYEAPKGPNPHAYTYGHAESPELRGCNAATSSNIHPLSPADGDFAAAAPEEHDVQQAQQVVKEFVKNIVKGQEVEVLSTKGTSAQCVVSLDRKLTLMTLQRAGRKDSKKREIPLDTIEQIFVGADVAGDVALPIDDMCVTFILQGDDGVLSYRFVDYEQRDTFALCLSMFVDGRRTECERKKQKKSKGR